MPLPQVLPCFFACTDKLPNYWTQLWQFMHVNSVSRHVPSFDFAGTIMQTGTITCMHHVDNNNHDGALKHRQGYVWDYAPFTRCLGQMYLGAPPSRYGICWLLSYASWSRMTRVRADKRFCASHIIAIGWSDSHAMFASAPNDNGNNTIIAVTTTIHSNSWCQWRDCIVSCKSLCNKNRNNSQHQQQQQQLLIISLLSCVQDAV